MSGSESRSDGASVIKEQNGPAIRSSRGRVVKPRFWAEDGEEEGPVAGFRSAGSGGQSSNSAPTKRRRASSAGLDNCSGGSSSGSGTTFLLPTAFDTTAGATSKHVEDAGDSSDDDLRHARRIGGIASGLTKRGSVPLRDHAGRFIGVRAKTSAERMHKAVAGSGGVFKSAAVTILQEQMRLLTTGDIARLAMRRSLIQCHGKTPEATMASALYTDVKKKGGNSVFMRPHEGLFGLREWAEAGLTFHADGTQATTEEHPLSPRPAKRPRSSRRSVHNAAEAAAALAAPFSSSLAVRGGYSPRNGATMHVGLAAAAAAEDAAERPLPNAVEDFNIMLLVNAAEELHRDGHASPDGLPALAATAEVARGKEADGAMGAGGADAQPPLHRRAGSPFRAEAELHSSQQGSGAQSQQLRQQDAAAGRCQQDATDRNPARQAPAATKIDTAASTTSSDALNNAAGAAPARAKVRLPVAVAASLLPEPAPASPEQLRHWQADTLEMEHSLGTLDPQVGNVWLFLARVHQTSGNTQAAEAALARAVSIFSGRAPDPLLPASASSPLLPPRLAATPLFHTSPASLAAAGLSAAGSRTGPVPALFQQPPPQRQQHDVKPSAAASAAAPPRPASAAAAAASKLRIVTSPVSVALSVARQDQLAAGSKVPAPTDNIASLACGAILAAPSVAAAGAGF